VEINEVETNSLIQKSIDIQYCSTFSQTTRKNGEGPFEWNMEKDMSQQISMKFSG
jgi:hypothetical protein